MIASQTATHFPRQQLADLALIYGFVRKADAFAEPEVGAWTELSAMAGRDGASIQWPRTGCGPRWDRPCYFSRTRAVLSLRVIEEMKNVGLPFGNGDLAVIAGRKKRITSSGNRARCLPIGPAVGAYGQAPLNQVPAQMDKAMKNLPDFHAASALRLLPGTGKGQNPDLEERP